MEKVSRRGRQKSGFDLPDAQPDSSEWEKAKTMIDLLRHQIVLLAMKHGRAPLSVSPALWRRLVKLGAFDDLYELGSIARRLSFLGDGRILLAELRAGTNGRTPVEVPEAREIEIGAEHRP